ncbi:LPS export ABC transporter periplasmic protein LptC [Defluviicoccus vanus]|uniref:LPS export ABC transporter periplasmic protein LptC n=1 Tax=Defluviicoccus vanus TaxID=111831 RepID=A0A7H1N0W5_9PROT|nr:LPS export ABC transporter periplasmic protein LptC [Defluviicoccus vanus]QNT69351.1 LPS export ABC transporter periplasmic protein LptC [Defluviicoccus vanus]
MKAEKQASHRETLGGASAAAATRSRSTDAAAERRLRSYRRVARWGLVGVVVLVVLFIALWPELKPSTTRVQVSNAITTANNVVSNRDAAMDAHFTGTDRFGRPFTITAPQVDSAGSGAGQDGMILTKPISDMTMTDGRKVHLTADRGVYNPDAKVVDLYGNVVFVDENGYRVETSTATIKLDEGLVTGAEPVVGYASFGKVDGVGFRIVNSGENVFVNGPARMRITSAQPRLP